MYEEPVWTERHEVVRWVDERARVQRAIILGAPGGGKSFLTDNTAVELASKALDDLDQRRVAVDQIPLIIHLQLADLAGKGLPTDPVEAVLRAMAPAPLTDRLKAWMRHRIPTNSCWLILDALDQVDPKKGLPRLSRLLEAMDADGWKTHIFLTCRTANFDRTKIPWRTLTQYELAPFDPGEMRQFVTGWFDKTRFDHDAASRGRRLAEVLGRSYSLLHACRSPMLLTLACLAHNEGPELSDQTRRVDLYPRVLRALCRRAWHKDGALSPEDPQVEKVIKMLRHVGRNLFELSPESNQFTDTEVTSAITAATKAISMRRSPDRVMNELIKCGILFTAGLKDGKELQFSFLHRSFVEFLAAWSLAEEVKKCDVSSADEFWGQILRKAWLPTWEEVILFLAGMLDDPEPLLARLSDEMSDCYFRTRLCLAARCLPELSKEARGISQPLSGNVAEEVFELAWEQIRRGPLHEHVKCSLPAAATPEVRGRLAHFLRYGESDDVRYAARALGDLGAAGATLEFLACLAELLRDEESGVRSAAAEAVGGLIFSTPLPFRFQSNPYGVLSRPGRSVGRGGGSFSAACFFCSASISSRILLSTGSGNSVTGVCTGSASVIRRGWFG